MCPVEDAPAPSYRWGCGMPRKVHAKSRRAQKKDEALDLTFLNKEGAVGAAASIAIAQDIESLAVRSAIPAGGALDGICNAVQKHTDIPLGIALCTTIALTSWQHVRENSRLCLPSGQEIEQAVWQWVLAPSGCGKTLLRNLIAAAYRLNSTEILSEAAGPRAWLDSLKKLQGRALDVRDEAGEYFRRICRDEGPMSDLRALYLRAYDNDRLERTSAKDSVVVERPCLVLLASSVDNNIHRGLDAASLIDGLGARIAFVLAPRDPLRKSSDAAYAFYDLPALSADIAAAVEGMPLVQSKYFASPEVMQAFKKGWKQHAPAAMSPDDPNAVGSAFFRRAAWRAWPYAVFFHRFAGNAGTEIEAVSMAAAWRLVALNLASAKRVMHLVAGTDYTRLMDRLVAAARRRKASNVPIDHRWLHNSFPEIKSAGEARQLIMVLESILG